MKNSKPKRLFRFKSKLFGRKASSFVDTFLYFYFHFAFVLRLKLFTCVAAWQLTMLSLFAQFSSFSLLLFIF